MSEKNLSDLIDEVKYNLSQVIEYNQKHSTGDTKFEINSRVSTLLKSKIFWS